MTDYRYDVFISYSHADHVWVWGELLPRLEAAGLRVCIDQRDFAIGVPIPVSIEQAINASRHTVAVLSPAWVAGEWTELEGLLLSSADPAARRRRLLPLLLQPCDLPTRIGALGYADLTQPEQYEFQFNRLIQQLRQTNVAPPPPAPDTAPFVVGPPITAPSRFFGRRKELRRIFNLLRTFPLQNAAIIGQRRSGKTSLLQHLQTITTTPAAQLRPGQRHDWLPQPERYRWVFVDFQDARLGSRSGLLRHLLTSLALPIPGPCDLERCLDVLSQHLRTPTVILLDELGLALERYPELDMAFWESLRALATTQVGGNLAFVLAAHAPPMDLAQHSGRSSPFFNIFGYSATLGPLTELEARELIASSPLPFPDADSDWILAQSGRWPILLQILCRERLLSLEDGDDDEEWQAEGLRQMEPFRGLLDG